MRMATLTALFGLALIVAGATGFLADNSLAVGAVLLLVAATVAAVLLEEHDLESGAALVRRDPAEAAVLRRIPSAPAAHEPPMRDAA